MMRKRLFASRPFAGTQAKKQRVEITKLKRQVARLKPELKICPVAISFTNLPNTGAVGYLSGVAQGSNETERDGNQIRPQYIDVKIQLTSNLPTQTATTAPYLYSAYIIKDMQSSGTVPTVSGTVNSMFVGNGPYTAFIQYNTRDRFKILKEFHWNNAGLNNGAQPSMKSARVRLSGVTDFHDTTAAQASAGKNAYYLVMLTNDPAALVDFDAFIQFAYTDV